MNHKVWDKVKVCDYDKMYNLYWSLFIKERKDICWKIATIKEVKQDYYKLEEDYWEDSWFEDMVEWI